jgi:hypothetical protein
VIVSHARKCEKFDSDSHAHHIKPCRVHSRRLAENALQQRKHETIAGRDEEEIDPSFHDTTLFQEESKGPGGHQQRSTSTKRIGVDVTGGNKRNGGVRARRCDHGSDREHAFFLPSM